MIALTPILSQDLPRLVELANREDVKHAFGYEYELARPDDVAAVLTASRPGTTTKAWSVIAGEQIVGCIALLNIHPVHKNAEIGHRVIDPKAGWLVGLQAVEQVAAIGFNQLNLNRLECLIHDDNRASILLCERLKRRGLVREGVLRKAAWRSGEWRDVTVYAILREDYRE